MFCASFSLSLFGRCVNTYYKPPNRTEVRPVGKCFVSKVDDEKTAFSEAEDLHKNPTLSIIASFLVMEGRRKAKGNGPYQVGIEPFLVRKNLCWPSIF